MMEAAIWDTRTRSSPVFKKPREPQGLERMSAKDATSQRWGLPTSGADQYVDRGPQGIAEGQSLMPLRAPPHPHDLAL